MSRHKDFNQAVNPRTAATSLHLSQSSTVIARAKLTLFEFDGTMTDASTSLGEASARIQATDLERRKTPRVRTAPPGLRVEPKWLPACIFRPGYAVQCQSSDERGAAAGRCAGSASSRVQHVGTPVCPGREEVRRSESDDSPYPRPVTISFGSDPGAPFTI